MKRGHLYFIKILITLSHVRQSTSFYAYIFRSPISLLFLLHIRGWGCLILLNSVLFILEIPNEIILLCMDYDAALRLERMKAERSKQVPAFKEVTQIIWNLFDSLEKWLMSFNHSASNCIKPLLIIRIQSTCNIWNEVLCDNS